MSDDRKYVRVYYSVINDDRFADIYHDARRLGTWLQLLLIADAMFPADAPVPAYVHGPSLKALTDCGLVEIRAHQHFRLHGLASERGVRSQSGRNAAAMRWQSGRNADPMPRQDEHRQDETSIARPREMREQDPEKGGVGPTSPGIAATRREADRMRSITPVDGSLAERLAKDLDMEKLGWKVVDDA